MRNNSKWNKEQVITKISLINNSFWTTIGYNACLNGYRINATAIGK